MGACGSSGPRGEASIDLANHAFRAVRQLTTPLQPGTAHVGKPDRESGLTSVRPDL
jgi:hypothetical protein